MLTFAALLLFSTKQVAVMTCDGKLARIFADSKLSIPMANPFIAPAVGKPNFWVSSGCYYIR